MEQELKDKWVAALESGDYPQGKVHLCGEGRYCCLGVLSEVSGLQYEELPNDGSRRYFYGTDLPSAYFPGDEYLNSIGLSHSFASELAHLNDVGKSFEDIAQKIREEA